MRTASWTFKDKSIRTCFLIVWILLSACSDEHKIRVCSGNHWWDCKNYSSEAEYEEDEKKALALDIEESKRLDIDFDSCAAILIKDQMQSHTEFDGPIFISVLTGDPSENMLARLNGEGFVLQPASKRPHDVMDDGRLTISVGFIRGRLWGGYVASAGYYCGPLCAASFEYRLDKNGRSCIIKSKNLIWIS